MRVGLALLREILLYRSLRRREVLLALRAKTANEVVASVSTKEEVASLVDDTRRGGKGLEMYSGLFISGSVVVY